MIDPSPRHIRDVQKAVDATEIDECSEVGDILDDAFANLIQFYFGHQIGLQFITALLKKFAPADDDIHSRLVDLDDLALQVFADEF